MEALLNYIIELLFRKITSCNGRIHWVSLKWYAFLKIVAVVDPLVEEFKFDFYYIKRFKNESHLSYLFSVFVYWHGFEY